MSYLLYAETLRKTSFIDQSFVIRDDVAKLILGQRMAYPGDYLVHENYGIGQYIGIKYANLTPDWAKPTYEPLIVVKYDDGILFWYKRLAVKEFLMYKSFSASADSVIDNSIDEESFVKASVDRKILSSLMDLNKWKRKLSNAVVQSKKSAINLIRLMTIRFNIHRTPCHLPNDNKYSQFENSFEYKPTLDQLKCIKAIRYDMTRSSRPMDRLICGDVGFGKTEVAIRAMYLAVLANRQVAFLAPTRVLALQHLRTIQNRMPDVNVVLLRGGSKGDINIIKDAIKNGRYEVVVGTHAILEGVEFKQLGLLIIDEEQRFGVGHKEKLKLLSLGVDVLTLSATPIPRTLHMSISGLRCFSLINTPPVGRKEVQVVVGLWNNETVVKAIKNEIARDGQVFLVVPFIRECELMSAKLKYLIPNIRVIEANSKHDDLELRIDSFIRREADVLIATTVIENGIDMPNVNTILVYCADRFGMSTLYQLRGRVGRSSVQAYAYFFTNQTQITVEAENRLTYLKTFTALGSGYELAMRDMDIRGHGSLFGEDQSGSSNIGIELQARLMNRAIEDIKNDLFIPVSDTRLSLDMEVENFSKKINRPAPTSSDLNDHTAWEDRIAGLIIAYWLRGKCSNEEIAKVLKEYLNANSLQNLLSLQQSWISRYGLELPALVKEMIIRSVLRINFRRLSFEDVYMIKSIDNLSRTIVCASSSLNEEKWNTISSAIQEDLRCLIQLVCSGDGTSSNQVLISIPSRMNPEETLELLVTLSSNLVKQVTNIFDKLTLNCSSDT